MTVVTFASSFERNGTDISTFRSSLIFFRGTQMHFFSSVQCSFALLTVYWATVGRLVVAEF